MSGLVYCFNDTWIPGFCTEKLLECILSFSITSVVLLQLYCRFRAQGFHFNTRLIIFLEVILATISNGFLCIFHNIVLFFKFETFFFDTYFITIVLYVTKKLLLKIYPDKSYTITILYVVYIIFLMFYIFILVDSTIISKQRCEQMWYLVTRLSGVILAIGLYILAKINHKKQQRILLQYDSIKSINNPLSRLWTWIGFNIIAQLINIIITMVFLFDPSLDCKYDKHNADINYFIAFTMIVATFELPFVSTLYIFWTPICKTQIQQNFQREQQDSSDHYHHGIQIMTVKNQSISE